MSRRGATDLAGILPIDKPSGPTSHDVVARIRRATGEGRVGHAGTLDPLATGLLVVLIGPYTRLEPYLMSAVKSYTATIAWGAETDTDDAEGSVTDRMDVPDGLFDRDHAQTVLDGFVGPALQMPPAYSAIKVGGRTAHRAARAGDPLLLEPRPVEILAASLVDVDADARTWTFDVRVSKGTYIRSLARDIGRFAGSAAHLASLRRTASGLLSLDDAVPLDEAVAASADIVSLFADPVAALGFPTLEGDPRAVSVGAQLRPDPGPPAADGCLVSVTVGGSLAGLYRVDEGALRPEIVLGRAGAA